MVQYGVVICVGGTTVDFHAEVNGAIRMRSSNPGQFSMSPGGVARNIAENSARLGLPTALLSWVGTDILSEWVLERTQTVGVDVRTVRRSESSALGRYLSVLEAGEPLVSVSDFGSIERVEGAEVERALESVRGVEEMRPTVVVADCNLGREALQACLDWSDRWSVPCIVDPVSVAKLERLYTLHGTITVLTPNAEEASTLLARRADLPDIETWVVTRGASGAAIWSDGAPIVRLVVGCAQRVVNANGAGDAFIAGLIAGLSEGVELDGAVRWGVAAGSLAVTSSETVPSRMTRAELMTILSRERCDDDDPPDVR